MPDWEALELAADKSQLVSMAQTLGVPTPRSVFLDSMNDLEQVPGQFEFPLVIKPCRSAVLSSKGWIRTSISYAHSMTDLVDRIKTWPRYLPLPMIQQRIQGAGSGAFLLFDHGQEKAVFFHRRLREKPPSGGVSVLREAVAPDTRIKDYSVSLLEALKWHGVAMVEFKYDDHDGLPKLMEVNPRFWGSLQLAIDAGMDFPALLYGMITEGDVPAVEDYRVGVKTRWLLGDLDQLLMRLFKSRRSLNLPNGFPGRVSAAMEFLNFFQSDTRLEVFTANDLSPALYEMKLYLRDLLRRG